MTENIMNMSSEELREMQLIQLDMLEEVKRICEKNNIKYCIIAGTLLGAVRHKGYIPWDDDADIAMLRDEYDKFCKVCELEINREKFYFQNHNNTEDYRWGYGKVRRVGTEFVRKGQEHMKFPTGVFIDIFPIDNVPDNLNSRRIHNMICTIVRKFLWSKVGAKSEKIIIMRYIYKLMAIIPRNIIFKFYDILVHNSNKKDTKMGRILTFPTPNNGQYGYYKKWYTDLHNIEFEGKQFLAPKDYDEYLSFKFGDYKVYPPEAERNGHAYARYKLLSK